MSIEPPRDQWQPTSHLRWNLGGKLQQMWWREVSEYSTYWKRTLWKPDYEWREVPTEQPAQETPAGYDPHDHTHAAYTQSQDTLPECTCGVGAPDRMPHDLTCPRRVPECSCNTKSATACFVGQGSECLCDCHKRYEQSVPDADVASSRDCSCKHSDTWRCAVARGLTSVSCGCRCHRAAANR